MNRTMTCGVTRLWLLIFALSVLCPAIAANTPLSGMSINIGAQSASAISSPAKAHALSWEKRTGAKATILTSPFGKLFVDYMGSLTAEKPVYDVLLFPSAWAADFNPYLAELPAALRESENIDDIHPIYRERLMTWDGKWIAVTIDGDLFNGYYRKDLFNDPINRAEFRARYGYELYPPDSWRQYRDIAAFFNGRKQTDDTPLYGTTEAFARGGQQFWTLFSRASAYTNHPEHPGAQFFDPDTMRSQIDNPGWLQAVRDYREILAFSPPDSLTFGIVEAREAFLKGQAAMTLDWGDTAQLAADPLSSAVSGKVGYFVLPGSNRVWNGSQWNWSDQAEIHKAPFLAFGGWVAGVARNSRNADAAWDYISWLSNPENSLHDVVTSGTGINPYRYTHFSNIDAWTQAFSRSAASEYLNVVRNSLDSPNVALDLRIPGFYRYTEALERELSDILSGDTGIEQGMKRVAAAWENITTELGRGKQLAAYRTAMGLSRQPAGPLPGKARHKATLKFGFSQATTTEPWRLLFNKELRAEAARHPEILLTVRDANDSVARQVADMDAFIAEGVDAILISPKVTEALTPPVSKAFAAGIPVFVLDRDVANDRYTQYIGGDNREIGRAAGREAVRLLGGEGNSTGNIVEIWGGMASTPAHDRHEGFMEIIQTEPGLTILNPGQDGDWKQDLAYGIMAEALDNHPRIDLVYAHNDPMAYGAYLAAKDAGRDTDTAFLGIDGIPEEGVTWVDREILDATFLYKTPGDEGIRQALRFLRGEQVAKRLVLPTMTIKKSNARQILDRHRAQ